MGSLKEVEWPVLRFFGGYLKGVKSWSSKEIANAKSMSLCRKKIVLPLLKKTASLTTFHFKIPLVKICPPTRKAKNQDDISLMTSSSPHYDICVYHILNPRFTSRNKSRYNRFWRKA